MIWLRAYPIGNHPPIDFGPYKSLGIEQGEIYATECNEVVIYLSAGFEGWVDTEGNQYRYIEVLTRFPKNAEGE